MLPFQVRVDLRVMASVLRIPQSSRITGASTSDRLVSYSGHALEESCSSAEMQSVYPTKPANWTTRRSLAESYPTAVMPLVYSKTPFYWTRGYPFGEAVLLHCRDLVSVFYNLIRLYHRTLTGGGLTSLQRCSWCILRPQPTGSLSW